MRPDGRLLVYVIAGEASGDLLGAGLMHALKARANIEFSGVGGEQMEAEGLSSLFPYHELSLMGFAEVVPHLMSLSARIQLVVDDITAKKPDVVVTIDSPGFNFRVVKKLREAGLAGTKFIHYVAPTVWAYKPERAKKCAGLFDHMLALLPFEPPYFEKEGLKCTFVGHPVAYKPRGDGHAFRAKYNIPVGAPVIGLFPGSRVNEIKRHMPAFGQAVTLLAQQMPGLSLVVPVHQRLLPLVATYFEGCPFCAVLTGEVADKPDALAAMDAALVKSGTVALEVAQAGVPNVVGYRANPISIWILKRLLTIRYANLVNVIANREVVPELLQGLCEPLFLANAVTPLLRDKEAADRQREAAAAALATLHAPGGMHPSEYAAEVVLGLA